MVTAHSAKGSEFAFVFLIGCTKDVWDDTGKGGNRSYKLPDNLVSNVAAADTLEESRRLFYVALTRAKTHLHISFPEKNEQGKAMLSSSFVNELASKLPLAITPKTVPDELLVDQIGLQFAATARPRIELMEKEYIDSLLKKYSLSVTHLNNYLECPIKFYYQNLIKVPGAKNEFMAFGSAVHYAMEMLFINMKNHDEVFPSVDELLGYFRKHMQNNREAFTPEQFVRRVEYGEKILPNYYNRYVHQWNKIVAVEKSIRQVVVQQVPINGKLDKIEFAGNEVNVVDYKTGNYGKAKEKLYGPSDEFPHGGDYWRQAVFYKILMDNDTRNRWTAISTEFDFVEPVKEDYVRHKIVISDSDITTVTHQITDTWQKIQRQEFHTGCGKEACTWCNFVKTNKLATALIGPEEEPGDEVAGLPQPE
jgi:DNA helicase-2/ATP-dependent DNA helicase PcrA